VLRVPLLQEAAKWGSRVKFSHDRVTVIRFWIGDFGLAAELMRTYSIQNLKSKIDKSGNQPVFEPFAGKCFASKHYEADGGFRIFTNALFFLLMLGQEGQGIFILDFGFGILDCE